MGAALSNDKTILLEPFHRLRLAFSTNRWVRLLGYGGALALFLIGGIAAFAHIPKVDSVRWPLFTIVACLGVPVTIFLNAKRFQVSGTVVGVMIGYREALAVTIASTASNVLPLPGGVAIRALALKRRETTFRRVGTITLATALLWLSGTLLLASVCLWILDQLSISVLCAVAGAVTGGIASYQIIVLGSGYRELTALCLIQVGLVLIDTFRVYWTILALGWIASYSQVGVLGIASFAGAAAGFAPGGLGVREVIAAALGLLVELDPAVAFTATAVNQIIGLIVVGMVIAVMMCRELRRD